MQSGLVIWHKSALVCRLDVLFALQRTFRMFSQRSLVERKRKLLSFSGPVVASVSLFNDKNGSVDNTIEDLLQYVSYLTSIGVTGFYVHGTTGEGLSLNHEEKKKLTENWCSVVKKVAPQALLIINISSCCVSDTLDHVSMCQKLDEVDAVACLPPIYHRPKDVEDLVKYMNLVSSAAPELPLLYYNFPEMTNVSLSMVEFVGTALKEMPNFAGLKFTSKNMAELADLRRSYGTQVKLFAGYEEVSVIQRLFLKSNLSTPFRPCYLRPQMESHLQFVLNLTFVRVSMPFIRYRRRSSQEDLDSLKGLRTHRRSWQIKLRNWQRDLLSSMSNAFFKAECPSRLAKLDHQLPFDEGVSKNASSRGHFSERSKQSLSCSRHEDFIYLFFIHVYTMLHQMSLLLECLIRSGKVRKETCFS